VSEPIKLIVGAGGVVEPGWRSLEQEELDVTRPQQWFHHFVPSTVDAVFAEHVWEHLEPAEAELATHNAFFFLKPGGLLRLAVPDGLHPSPDYINWVRPGGVWNPRDHKILFDYRSLSALLSAAGFEVRVREFWGETGAFYSELYNQTEGIVRRCAWGSESAAISLAVGARYTSLVIDAIKPL
jgi:predicted SAM-dependent methyltransferase